MGLNALVAATSAAAEPSVAALEYGMVGVNEGMISTEVAPFEDYLEIKYTMVGGLSVDFKCSGASSRRLRRKRNVQEQTLINRFNQAAKGHSAFPNKRKVATGVQPSEFGI